MKRIVFYAFLLGGGFMANAQVGIGTPTPVDAAMLDIDASDKGVLIPRVSLTAETSFSPIEGTETESLLVYNNGTVLSKGFYFWKDGKWNQIIDKASLEQAIADIIGGEGSDLGEVKKVVDFLVPTNPQSSDKTLSQAALVIDPEDNKIYSVSYDETTEKYIRTAVDFKDMVQDFETTTFFKRAEITADGDTPNFEVTNVAPDFTKTKKGEIYYQYLGENNQIDYLNLSADVTNIIENNEIIKNEITNILNLGGNVYFTTVAIDDIPANSLYYIDLDTKDKVVIDISSTVIHSITTNVETIKNELGNKITTGTVIKTGDEIDGDAVFIYKTTTGIKGAKADIISMGDKLHAGKKQIDRVINVHVFKDKKLITSAVTDVEIDATKTKISFNLGTGKMYAAIENGEYEIMLEFTAK